MAVKVWPMASLTGFILLPFHKLSPSYLSLFWSSVLSSTVFETPFNNKHSKQQKQTTRTLTSTILSVFPHGFLPPGYVPVAGRSRLEGRACPQVGTFLLGVMLLRIRQDPMAVTRVRFSIKPLKLFHRYNARFPRAPRDSGSRSRNQPQADTDPNK